MGVSGIAYWAICFHKFFLWHLRKVEKIFLCTFVANIYMKNLKLEQKMSFRDISVYFHKYHKLKVSYSTIYELWNKLENNTNINNEEN